MEFVFVGLAAGPFLEHHYFGLTEITFRAQVWQNLCRRSRCCCRPSLVRDRSTRSSTNSGHLTSDSSMVRPGAADCSSALANSIICMLKRVGLKLHPCLTPRSCGKKCVCVFLSILTTHLLFVYMDFIISCFSSYITFHQFV